MMDRLPHRPAARAVLRIKLGIIETGDSRGEIRRQVFERLDIFSSCFGRNLKVAVEFAYWITEVLHINNTVLIDRGVYSPRISDLRSQIRGVNSVSVAKVILKS